MNVSQTLNCVMDNNYEDDIIVSDVPKGYFPAPTSNSIADGADTREIVVEIYQLEASPGGNMSANPGLYVKSDDETQVKVTLKQDGKEIASNTQSY